jgi:hypothetical protein
LGAGMKRNNIQSIDKARNSLHSILTITRTKPNDCMDPGSQ